MKANGNWTQTVDGVRLDISIKNGQADLCSGGFLHGGTCDDVGDLLHHIAEGVRLAKIKTACPSAAAAPDLLDACKSALKALNNPDFDCYHDAEALEAKLESAIEKATGKGAE